MIYDTYVMDCPNCGPGTYRVEGGERLGCLCDYEPPSLVIDCRGDRPGYYQRWRQAIPLLAVAGAFWAAVVWVAWTVLR